MEDRSGKMGGFVAVVVFMGAVVTAQAVTDGVHSTVPVNGTLLAGVERGGEGANRDAMRLLLESSSDRMLFTVDDCVRSVQRQKKSSFGKFPPMDFVPPGAEEWCGCLEVDASGIVSLSSGDVDFSTEAGREPFEKAFDRCRGSVLDGSEIHTADICQGMVDLFGYKLAKYYATFCGRMCRSLENEYAYHYYREDNYPHSRVLSEFLSPLYDGCAKECSRKTMTGYCEKYKVWYTEWKFYYDPLYGFGSVIARSVGVGETVVARQLEGRYLSRVGREVAQSLCNALHPLLGGNINECCNYARAFGTLKECCVLDSNGYSVFDCEKNFTPESLLNFCWDQERAGLGYNYCSYVLLLRRDAPTVDWTTVKVWRENGTGQIKLSLPEAVERFACTIEPDPCCSQIAVTHMSAACSDPSTLTYVGLVSENFDAPAPGATEDKEEEEDPCLGLCEDGRECVFLPNGAAFCVNCSAFVKPKRSGDLAECCTYDSDERKCVSALKSSRPGICRRSEEIFVLAEEGSKQRVQFKRSEGFACMNARDFRRNGAACKVTTTRSGRTKCIS